MEWLMEFGSRQIAISLIDQRSKRVNACLQQLAMKLVLPVRVRSQSHAGPHQLHNVAEPDRANVGGFRPRANNGSY